MTRTTPVSLTKIAIREKFFLDRIESTTFAEGRTLAQQDMLTGLKNIGKSGNLEDIVAAEKSLAEFELEEHANSKSMESSLKEAKIELQVIQKNIAIVWKSEKYREVNESLGQPKLRDSHDLPLDGARIAFRSHIARLGNYNKARSVDIDKAIVQERQNNIRIAEKIYIDRQEKALGREPGEHSSKNPARAKKKRGAKP